MLLAPNETHIHQHAWESGARWQSPESFCYTQDQTAHLKVETPKGNC